MNSYLDWASTAPPLPGLAQDMADESIVYYANPSSIHAEGLKARAALEEARLSLAGSLGCGAESIIFTSGGTESNSILLFSLLTRLKAMPKSMSVLIAATEHPSVFEQARVLESFGIKLILARPDRRGILNPETVAGLVRDDTALISIMAVNNESGAISDLSGISKLIRESEKGKRIIIHSDAVQAFGKIPLLPEEWGLDALSLSGHKLGAPRGIGALYLSKTINPLVKGGGQEKGLRPGTSNTLAARAFSRASSHAVKNMDENGRRMRKLEAMLFSGINAIEGAVILPPGREAGESSFVPHIVSIAFPGLMGETLLRALSAEGIYVSTGSACSAGKRDGRVWEAMDTDSGLWQSSIRVSMGWSTREEEIMFFLETVNNIYTKFRLGK